MNIKHEVGGELHTYIYRSQWYNSPVYVVARNSYGIVETEFHISFTLTYDNGFYFL